MACGKTKLHASSFDTSCGVLSPHKGNTPQFRCDLKPGHTNKAGEPSKHHCCGGDWTKEWK